LSEETDLLKSLTEVANSKDTELEKLRSRGGHDKYRINTTNLIVPRHREINELTARSIIKTAEGA